MLEFKNHRVLAVVALLVIGISLASSAIFRQSPNQSADEGFQEVSETQVIGAKTESEFVPDQLPDSVPSFSDEIPDNTLSTSSSNAVKVIRVVDGDTIEIAGGQKIRYIGIDTPETVHPSKSVQCFGLEASQKNKELVEGKKVILEKDVSQTDKYGRLLRYVFVGDVFVNDYLVRNGFASASSYPPDIKYQDQLDQAEQEARQENRGLWGKCSSQSTQITQDQSKPEGCIIKGNISTSSGEKIYHVPGQKYYDKTVINGSRGERWFCTEDEAKSFGWRKSKR